MSDPERETTLDPVFAGVPACRQYRDGYRFNQDSIILAHFFEPVPGERILDLGTGCGIIGLVLAWRWPGVGIVGLEIQHDLAVLARRNARDHDFADRFEIVEGDFNCDNILGKSSFDRIVCNPPYLNPKKSRRCHNQEKNIARQGVQAGPAELAGAAARLLAVGGRFDLVYPASRTASLVCALNEIGLHPARMRYVHGFPGAPEMLVLIEAIKNGNGEPETLPPFFIGLEKNGAYSPEMKSCFDPGKRET